MQAVVYMYDYGSSPEGPITPTPTEACISLHNTIVQRNIKQLDVIKDPTTVTAPVAILLCMHFP